MNALYYRCLWLALILAIIVMLLGAYTRLKDAGLGCPDWPGCYGQVTVPTAPDSVLKANQDYPTQKIEANKAWLEMIHRYFAGSLGLLIFVLTAWSCVRQKNRLMKEKKPLFLFGIPLLLSLLVIFQAALGMWTVTLSLLPLVVVGHLLGGVLIVGLLWACIRLEKQTQKRSHSNYLLTQSFLTSSSFQPSQPTDFFKVAVILGMLLIFIQIFFGGWVSANYAALICADFPGCHGSWGFSLNQIQKAFNFFSPIGINYEGGVLDASTRTVIQMVHRYGALIVFLYVSILSFYLMMSKKMSVFRPLGVIIFALLLLQILLGILNIVWLLPIGIALAHQFVAVLLFLSMITLLCQ